MPVLDLQRAEGLATPWWLWWNILSADAPIVALVWSAVFARASGVKLATADQSTLVLTVWAIYVCDRLLDGWTAKNRLALQPRHNFCLKHSPWLVGLVVIAGAAIVCMTWDRQRAPEVVDGLKLGSIVAAYMVCIHAAGGQLARLLPKEAAVGILFASGTTLPLWSGAGGFSGDFDPAWTFFALLCILNCVSIECWEKPSSSTAWKRMAHPFVIWADSRINGLATALGACSLIAWFVRGPGKASGESLLAVCLGALLLLLLNCRRNRFSPSALRVLADVALIVPALIALAVRW
jgi:hypothetical protein